MICKECEETIKPFDCPLCDFKTVENSCLECHFEIVHDIVDYTPSSCNSPSVEKDTNVWDNIVKQYEKEDH